MLSSSTHWIWDSWYLRVDDVFHAWYLTAPRSLGDPGLRHMNASIGHATSPDLVGWTVEPDGLEPSPTPAWDDRACWTGCTIELPDGGYAMYYTGVGDADDGQVQRIGVATSSDLRTWSRRGVVTEADARWYETDPARTVDGVAWRDPFVLRGDDGRWHMLLTASASGQTPTTGGVVGHAVSDDLLRWEVLPPLTEPRGTRCLEVPQVVEHDGRHLLVYSVVRPETEQDVLPLGDTWWAPAAGPTGPFDLDAAQVLDADLYAGRVLPGPTGAPVLLGFVQADAPGGAGDGTDFVAAVADPRPLDLDVLLDPSRR